MAAIAPGFVARLVCDTHVHTHVLRPSAVGLTTRIRGSCGISEGVVARSVTGVPIKVRVGSMS